MTNDIIIKLYQIEFDFIQRLLAKEYEQKAYHSSWNLQFPCIDDYVDETFFDKAIEEFTQHILVETSEAKILDNLVEVFKVPMINLRLTDIETDLLDYAIKDANYGSRRTYLMELVRKEVKTILGLPLDNINDEALMVFIQAHKFDEYEAMKAMTTGDQFNLIIEKSIDFDSVKDYEKKRDIIYKQVGRGVK